MSPARRAVFSLLPALLLFAGLEAGLRLAGFRREAAPVVIRFGYPDPREMTSLFRPDPHLFWRLRPGSIFEAEASVPINSAGYRGDPPREGRSAESLRVAVLGDSVAFGGSVAWPELLRQRLESRRSGRPVEVLNFGVPGYSCVQGLRLWEDEVAGLRPDVVLVAFGWNDHWLARGGVPDHERRFPSATLVRLYAGLSRLRTVQAVHALIGAVRRKPRADGTGRRVPPEVFRDRMARIVDEVRAGGGGPVIVGLPSALVEGDVPPYLTEDGFTASAEAAIADHRAYVELARRAAEERAALFVDLVGRFANEDGRPDPSLFTRDRIHLSPEGHARAADAIADAVMGVLARGEEP